MADNNKPNFIDSDNNQSTDGKKAKLGLGLPKIDLTFKKPANNKPAFKKEDFALPSHKPADPGSEPAPIVSQEPKTSAPDFTPGLADQKSTDGFSDKKEKQELSRAIADFENQQKQQTDLQDKEAAFKQEPPENSKQFSQPIKLKVQTETDDLNQAVKQEAKAEQPQPKESAQSQEPVVEPASEKFDLKQDQSLNLLADEAREEDQSPIEPSKSPPTDNPPSGKRMVIPAKKGFPVIPLVAGLIIIAVAVAGFFIFKGNNQVSSKAVTLTYWGLWEPEPVMQGVIAQWEQEHPNIKINYLAQDKQDYRARLQSAFSRGEGPDIFRFHNTWLPMLKNELSPVPVTIANNLNLENNYFPVVSESLDYGGQFYGLPLMMDTLGFYYNKDILLAANKSPPLTWWGLENLAKELTVRVGDKISVAGVAMGTTTNVDHWSDILGLMIYQNGGNPHRPDSLVTDAAKFFLRFKTVDRVWDDSLPRSTLAFAKGKLVFYFGPSWRTFNILEANPNLNFGVAPMPQLPKLQDGDWQAAERGEEELTNIAWASFWVEGVALDSRLQKEAWEFLEFLSSKEIMQKLYTAQSQTRLFGELYPVKSLAKSLETDSILREFVAQADVAKTGFLCSETYDDGINERIIGYYQDFLNGLAGNSPEEDLMTTLSNGVSQVFSQYQVLPD